MAIFSQISRLPTMTLNILGAVPPRRVAIGEFNPLNPRLACKPARPCTPVLRTVPDACLSKVTSEYVPCNSMTTCETANVKSPLIKNIQYFIKNQTTFNQNFSKSSLTWICYYTSSSCPLPSLFGHMSGALIVSAEARPGWAVNHGQTTRWKAAFSSILQYSLVQFPQVWT